MSDGRYIIRVEGVMDCEIDHVTGSLLCREMTPAMRMPQHRGGVAVLTVPIAIVARILGNMERDRLPEGLMRSLALARIDLQARNKPTSLEIICGTMARDGDAGVPFDDDSSMEDLCDPNQDPVIASLMHIHCVDRIARTMPGVDAFWGGLERSQTSFGPANPFVIYTGLPHDFPPFMIRPFRPGHSSCVGVWFGYDGTPGSGALYCQQGGSAWIGVPNEVPSTIAMNLPGRPLTDLVGHPALEGWIILDPMDNGGNPNSFEIEWRP